MTSDDLQAFIIDALEEDHTLISQWSLTGSTSIYKLWWSTSDFTTVLSTEEPNGAVYVGIVNQSSSNFSHIQQAYLQSLRWLSIPESHDRKSYISNKDLLKVDVWSKDVHYYNYSLDGTMVTLIIHHQITDVSELTALHKGESHVTILRTDDIPYLIRIYSDEPLSTEQQQHFKPFMQEWNLD